MNIKKKNIALKIIAILCVIYSNNIFAISNCASKLGNLFKYKSITLMDYGVENNEAKKIINEIMYRLHQERLLYAEGNGSQEVFPIFKRVLDSRIEEMSAADFTDFSVILTREYMSARPGVQISSRSSLQIINELQQASLNFNLTAEQTGLIKSSIYNIIHNESKKRRSFFNLVAYEQDNFLKIKKEIDRVVFKSPFGKSLSIGHSYGIKTFNLSSFKEIIEKNTLGSWKNEFLNVELERMLKLFIKNDVSNSELFKIFKYAINDFSICAYGTLDIPKEAAMLNLLETVRKYILNSSLKIEQRNKLKTILALRPNSEREQKIIKKKIGLNAIAYDEYKWKKEYLFTADKTDQVEFTLEELLDREF